MDRGQVLKSVAHYIAAYNKTQQSVASRISNCQALLNRLAIEYAKLLERHFNLPKALQDDWPSLSTNRGGLATQLNRCKRTIRHQCQKLVQVGLLKEVLVGNEVHMQLHPILILQRIPDFLNLRWPALTDQVQQKLPPLATCNQQVTIISDNRVDMLMGFSVPAKTSSGTSSKGIQLIDFEDFNLAGLAISEAETGNIGVDNDVDSAPANYAKELWVAAKHLIYPANNFAPAEEEEIKRQINEVYYLAFYQQWKSAAPPSFLPVQHQQLMERLELAARWIDKTHSYTVPHPLRYFEASNRQGFVATKSWLLRQKLLNSALSLAKRGLKKSVYHQLLTRQLNASTDKQLYRLCWFGDFSEANPIILKPRRNVNQ
jgi:hypothetical protein